MQKYCLGAAGLLGVLLLTVFLSSCDNSTKPDPNQLAPLIKSGTSIAVSLGMVAVPNSEEALKAAKEALSALDQNVLPILKGDEQGFINGLRKILTLEALNNPELDKVKLVLETAMPLLKKYLPANLADNAVGKIKPEVKLYIVAFFEGAREGLQNYIGDGLRGSYYQDLRGKLAK